NELYEYDLMYGVDAVVLGRGPEQVLRMRDHELIEGGAARDEDGRRGARTSAGSATLLPERGDRPRVAGQHGDVEMSDIDAELEGVRGNDAQHLAGAEPLLHRAPSRRQI